MSRSTELRRAVAVMVLAGLMAGAPFAAHGNNDAHASGKRGCGAARRCCCAKALRAVVCQCSARRPLPLALSSSAERATRLLEWLTALERAPLPAADAAAQRAGLSANDAEAGIPTASPLERFCVWLI